MPTLDVTTRMRNEYGRVLRLAIEEGLHRSAFGWQAQKIKSPYVFPGERVFSKTGNASLLFWCALVVHERFDKFTFEVCWSAHRRFPELSVRPSLQAPAKAHGLPEYMVRLGQLIGVGDHWWEVEAVPGTSNLQDIIQLNKAIRPEVARARVAPAAASALAALEKHAVPFLNEVRSAHA